MRLRCLVGFYMLWTACGWPLSAAADIELSGGIRDDAFVLGQGSEAFFNNILESKLIMQRQADQWKFYSDLRLYAYHGETLAQAAEAANADFYSFRLLRAFVRYYSGIGDFSAGKTYVNFGVPGVFNPFEIDRSLNPTDLNYTKEGIVALAYEGQLDALSGVKAYAGPAGDTSAAAGLCGFTHVGTFDLGAAAVRRSREDMLAGVYFQGDAEVGVQGAYAFHWRDTGQPAFSEAYAGVDYSFFDQKLVTAVQAYYHEVTGSQAKTDVFTGLSSGQAGGSFFTGRFYGYAYALYAPDEFFQARLDVFLNAADASSLLIPSATWVLADGLNLTLQAIFLTGTGDTQFSRDAIADYIGLARIEAKL